MPTGAPKIGSPSRTTLTGRYRLEYPIGHVLYELSSGYISNVCISPQGDLVAFAEHPVFGDNAGTVAVIDSSGRKSTISPQQAALASVVWAPSGNEVWFSAADDGFNMQLKASDMSAHLRAVLRVPGFPIINQIASDGRVLLTNASFRNSALALGPGQDQERDLTITDVSFVHAISREGRGAVGRAGCRHPSRLRHLCAPYGRLDTSPCRRW